MFLQATISFEDHKEYKERTGIFINKLIQESYDAGHNGFELNTMALPLIDKIGIYIQGKEKRPIEITIHGNAGTIIKNISN